MGWDNDSAGGGDSQDYEFFAPVPPSKGSNGNGSGCLFWIILILLIAFAIKRC